MVIVVGIKNLNWNIKILLPDKESISFFCSVFSEYNILQTDNINNVDCTIEIKNSSDKKYNCIFAQGYIYENKNLEEIYVLICTYLFSLKKFYDKNFWILHGAAFIYKTEIGLLLGPTHSGKSTLITQLLSNKDVKYITDDSIVFQKETLDIVPFPKPINLRNINAIYNCIEKENIYQYNRKHSKLYTYYPQNRMTFDTLQTDRLNIFVLNRSDMLDNVSLDHMKQSEGFLSILFNSFQPQFHETYSIAKKLLKKNSCITKVSYRGNMEALQLIISYLDTTGSVI